MKALYDVPAPAKLNLFLHVTGRRADGYHLLQSAFMLIDWCDTLHFELRGDGGIAREDLAAPLPADDLTLRAARALKAAAGTPLGAQIGVDKRIPAQAGLGGGSSDAATCLLALNRLWTLRLPLPALERIALQLGADVPFFLRGRNAWVEGIGERIAPLDGALALPPARFVVARPQRGLETGRVFAAPELERATPTAIISRFAADPFGFGHNDLQPVAERLCPDIAQALDWLSSRGLAGRMTGSGSAVFARMPDAAEGAARRTLTDWPADWQVRECCNLEAHPLLGWAASDDGSVGG
ncbi:MAG: 4-diphosphocytidyl-2-C-methyl-D-erythritol kinase [Burkholderiaceae bacterium]|jgi:4-diphosphocytidyl-2-C-methyl-D-erythritol kinase|nr:MAG: 4-diphosphocytidyl-2-C-methyl-D-erythritol kinase [Burkholderiaceae bacterium]